MDTRLMENILAIADKGSISRAAESLYITQSALTQQLMKLENELGTPLFERHRQGVVPTYAGRIYLEAARHMLDAKKETYKIIRDIRDENAGELRTAFTPETGSEVFADAYPLFHERYPNVAVRTWEARGDMLDQLVLKRTVSISCTSYYGTKKHPELKYHDFKSEHMVLGLPKSHPLAYIGGDDSFRTLPVLDLELLKDDEFIMPGQGTRTREMVDEAFMLAGYKPQVLFEAINTHTLVRMVMRQIGPAFFPQSYADPELPIVYFTVLPRRMWTLSMVHLRDAYVSRPEKYFMELMARYYGADRPFVV